MISSLTHRPGPRADCGVDDIDRWALARLERGEAPWLAAGAPCFAGEAAVAVAPTSPDEAEEAFLEMFAATGIDFRLGAMRTFYSFCDDVIVLADWREADQADFLRDWIHELVHATGHPSRLARDLPRVFGPTAHGIEHLIAEIGASLVCASLGIEPRLRHPASLEGWAELLRADRRIYGRAMRLAREAADYLFARRDAQAAAFDCLEAEETRAALEEAGRAVGARPRRRRQERKRWAVRCATGMRPGESLPASRSGGTS
jgi:hypothetical protein